MANMDITAEELRREYQREWYGKYPGKQQECVARYWQKKADEANKAGQEPTKRSDPRFPPVERQALTTGFDR